MTSSQVLDAYRAIKRAHPDLRTCHGPQILGGLERKLGSTEMACAELERLFSGTALGVLMCQRLRAPRMHVATCAICDPPSYYRAPTQAAADALLALHTRVHAS
jgi:hypothetical protein